MSFEFPPELRQELMDDFYAEADEHLQAMRERIVALEKALAASTSDFAALDSMYRSVHSLKGISAIAGLRQTEALAHTVESYLRLLSKREAELTPEGLQTLISAMHRMEHVVSAHRQQGAIPEVSDLEERLATLVAGAVSPALAGRALPLPMSPAEQPAAGASSGAPVAWLCRFSPSQALDARGVNLNAVRARLAELGQVSSATPKIGPSKSISFEFTVAFHQPPNRLEEWKADGVELFPPEPPPRPEAPLKAGQPDSESASSLFIAPSHLVRVDLSRLDELMRLVGELVIQRARLEERLVRVFGSLTDDRNGLQEVNLSMARTLRDLREGIATVRLVPIGEIFTRMPFVVRDLGHEHGKLARVLLEGEQTEVDKYLVERLKEPLLHLVRNAISHGVETPEQRAAAGKPPQATIVLHASTVGETVLIRVKDDGRGIDPDVVAARARANGIPVPEELGGTELLEILCQPNFSTREEADRAAGRGVGMAVVSNTVRELGGLLSLESQVGRGSEFLLRIPLTLSISDALIVRAGEQTCAVPQAAVQEILRSSRSVVQKVKNVDLVPYRDGVLPLTSLRSFLRLPPVHPEELTVLVLNSERGQTGLVVDRVLTQREVVVRAMKDPLVQVPGIAGATELGDGKPVLFLDTSRFGDGVARPRSGASR